MNNTFCHVEFETKDMVRAQAFYEGLFGWTFQSFGDEMVIFGLGDKHLGGLSKVKEVTIGRSPSVWLQVESIDGTVECAKRLGAKVLSEKHELPHVGWSAQIEDLDGNPLGLVQFAAKE